MPYTLEKTATQSVKIRLVIPQNLVQAGMVHAAEHIGESLEVPGFRKGHVPADVVRAKVGEMALLEHASEELIRAQLTEALLAEDLDIVGSPYFSVEKMAPDNELVVIAEIALMPAITKLADYTALSISPQSTEPTPELLNQAKTDLCRMRKTEVRAEQGTELGKNHKAVVDLSMKKDGVAVADGDAKNYGVFTNETHYIPGFVDALLGAKEGEVRTFTLPFPEDHYQKHLAGQPIEFSVKLNEIFAVTTPEFTDELAQAFRIENAQIFEEKLKENLKNEREQEESRRQEKAVLELIAEKSSFETINDLLVNQEIEKMVHELKTWVAENGMEFDAYMKSINKSIPEMKLDFTPQAIMRIKVALVLKEIAKKENVSVEEKAIDDELDSLAKMLEKDPEAKERVYSPEYRERITQQLINRKTIDLLKKIMVHA